MNARNSNSIFESARDFNRPPRASSASVRAFYLFFFRFANLNSISSQTVWVHTRADGSFASPRHHQPLYTIRSQRQVSWKSAFLLFSLSASLPRASFDVDHFLRVVSPFFFFYDNAFATLSTRSAFISRLSRTRLDFEFGEGEKQRAEEYVRTYVRKRAK